jgi:hypothetical protein
MAARKNPLLWAIIIIILLIIIMMLWRQFGDRTNSVKPVSPEDAIPELVELQQVQEQYDVIVVGTDPEGVVAAVSAARNGLKTLLVDGRNREILGGLFTIGWLNSLDMNRAPDTQKDYLNKGLFKEWYDQIEGDSFDVTTAAVAFNRMVQAESNIDLVMKASSIEPLLEGTTVTGIKMIAEDGTERIVLASAVIDATQDADIAAAAGVPYTYGREDIGDTQQLMAVTPVFKMKNVTPDVWKKIKDRLNGDDDAGTGANDQSAWGYKEMWEYPSTQPEILRSRGLNLGHQNDETVLSNSIQVFGIDPFDPVSYQSAFDALAVELPSVISYIHKNFPELAQLEAGEMAKELYVRETRHIIGEYRLSMVDLLEQRDHWDRIGFGSYPVDIQSTAPVSTNRGGIVMAPKQYAIPFRAIVPQQIDGLLVVGRSASFDTLPHGSARVVPVGMATGEAAGAAAKLAQDEGISFRELSKSEELIAKLQEQLVKQGMVLDPIDLKQPSYMKHHAYEGLKAAVSMGLVYGNYDNDFLLDQPSNVLRFLYNTRGVMRVHQSSFTGNPDAAISGIDTPEKVKLTYDQAAFTLLLAVGEGEEVTRETAAQLLQEKGWISERTLGLIANKDELTNGDAYMIFADVLKSRLDVTYE